MKKLLRPLYPRLVRLLARVLPKNIMRDKRFFDIWQAQGYHITPIHYYEPIPDTTSLPESLWDQPSRLPGIDMRDEVQLRLLDEFVANFKKEWDLFPLDCASDSVPFWINNESFVSVDAEILYCMIRQLRPRRIIEVGSGYSTLVMSHAIRKNAADGPASPCTFTVVDPYPWQPLLSGCDVISSFLRVPVQEIPLSVFESLEANDILFIDSSHVAKAGSDVNYELLEVIPSLNNGVMVHVHDVFLPFEYPKQWVIGKKRFWNEQYVLQAFLAFNSQFQVCWAGSYMSWKYPDRLAAAFRSYRPQLTVPASFWMVRSSNPNN